MKWWKFLEFECGEGHVFHISPTKLIHRGQWCPICAAKTAKARGIESRKSIREIASFAEANGGSLLSSVSKGAHTKHLWRCGVGHDFHATPANVLMGKWCPKCSKLRVKEETRRKYEGRFIEFLAEKGGKIAEGKYLAAKKKLTIQCEYDHVWSTTPDSILHGSWCPDCRKGK